MDEEEEEMLAKEKHTKRRHESTVSAPAGPLAINPFAQRLTNLSEIDDDGEGLVRMVHQK